VMGRKFPQSLAVDPISQMSAQTLLRLTTRQELMLLYS
jgi:hypothetical protein